MNIRFQNETDVEYLRKVAQVQDAELHRLAALVVGLKKEVASLRGDALTQGELDGLLKAEVEKLKKTTSKTTPPRKPRKPRTKFGSRAQEELETETQVLQLDEADRICPDCGFGLAEIVGQFDRSELIDVVEVQYKRVILDVQKYRCPKGCCIDQPLAIDRLISGGRYSIDFGARVAADKYCNHIPLASAVTNHGSAWAFGAAQRALGTAQTHRQAAQSGSAAHYRAGSRPPSHRA